MGQRHHAAVVADSCQGAHQRLSLDRAAVGRPQGGLRPDVRLALAHEPRVDQRQVLDAVGSTSPFQLLQLADLLFISRDNQLAALPMRHVVGAAEFVQQVAPLDRQPSLQRAGRIVDPGVNDAAVVGAAFHPGAGTRLEQADGSP